MRRAHGRRGRPRAGAGSRIWCETAALRPPGPRCAPPAARCTTGRHVSRPAGHARGRLGRRARGAHNAGVHAGPPCVFVWQAAVFLGGDGRRLARGRARRARSARAWCCGPTWGRQWGRGVGLAWRWGGVRGGGGTPDGRVCAGNRARGASSQARPRPLPPAPTLAVDAAPCRPPSGASRGSARGVDSRGVAATECEASGTRGVRHAGAASTPTTGPTPDDPAHATFFALFPTLLHPPP